MWWALAGGTVALASILTAVFSNRASERKLGAALRQIRELEEEKIELLAENDALRAPPPSVADAARVLDAASEA